MTVPINAPDFPLHWQITAPNLLVETHSSFIWQAQITGKPDFPVIIKALKPEGAEEWRGASYLRYRNGDGAIRLYDSHPPLMMMMLEYAGNYDLKTHLENGHDGETIAIAAEVIRALHHSSKAPLPQDLQPLRQHFNSLFALPATAGALYREAAQLIMQLLEQPHQVIALHGDLHHENIIRSPRGWLAIDPHGLCGDAAFDCANLFYNPLDRDDLCLDTGRALTLATIFAGITGRSVATLLDYAVGYGCLSAAWHREDGNSKDEARELQIAAALRKLRQQAAR